MTLWQPDPALIRRPAYLSLADQFARAIHDGRLANGARLPTHRALADVLKLFDMVFVMTRGGPGSATDLVSIYIQRVGFRIFDLGTASAQAILLLILTVVISRLYIRVLYREVN